MIQFQFNGRRGLANDLIVGIADGKAAIGQEGEAVWVVKFWLAVNAVGGAGFTGESSHGGDSAVARDGANGVVARVGYINGSIRRNDDAKRRIEARQGCNSIQGATLSIRAGNRGCHTGGSDFADDMVAGVGDAKVAIRRNRN